MLEGNFDDIEDHPDRYTNKHQLRGSAGNRYFPNTASEDDSGALVVDH